MLHQLESSIIWFRSGCLAINHDHHPAPEIFSELEHGKRAVRQAGRQDQISGERESEQPPVDARCWPLAAGCLDDAD